MTPVYWHKPRHITGFTDGGYGATLYGRFAISEHSQEDADAKVTKFVLADHKDMFAGKFDLPLYRKLLDEIRYAPIDTGDSEIDKLAAATLGGCLMDEGHVNPDRQPDWWPVVFPNCYRGELPAVASSIDTALQLAGAYLRGFEMVALREDRTDPAKPICVCRFEASMKHGRCEPVYQVVGQASTLPRAILVATVLAVILIKYGSRELDRFLTTEEKDASLLHGTDYCV